MTKEERIQRDNILRETKNFRKKLKWQLKGRKWSKDDTVKAVKSDKEFLAKKANELRKYPTAAERMLKTKLEKLEIEYVFQYAYYYRGAAGICDFYLPSYNLLIEVDGGYHLEEEQKKKDDVKDVVCRDNLNKPILRLTNKQAIYLSKNLIKTMIEDIGDN
jgi:very-short-patch-repair endonuclease